jgi:hypothetical protein
MREDGFIFRFVNGSICSCVDNDFWSDCLDELTNFIRFRKIHSTSIARDDLKPGLWQAIQQLGAKLPVGTE